MCEASVLKVEGIKQTPKKSINTTSMKEQISYTTYHYFKHQFLELFLNTMSSKI